MKINQIQNSFSNSFKKHQSIKTIKTGNSNKQNLTNYSSNNLNFLYFNYHFNFNPAFTSNINTKDNDEIAKRTQEPNLKTYIDLMSNKMKVGANIQFFLNALTKIDTDSKRTKQPVSIADIGCCDGALCRTLSEFLPLNTKYYGIDLSGDMLEKARKEDKEKGILTAQYEVANAFDLPYKNNPDKLKDAIIASSVMHEIYSYADDRYGEKAYSKESIYHFMQQAYDSLKPGGVLIIKDPATPQVDEWEKIKIVNANKNDGELPVFDDIEELKEADITKLSTYDKLRRFALDFYPAKGNIEFDKNGDCIMPRWLVCEFVRHRKWLATPENWAYEIKENYGTMRPDEIAEFAKQIGFHVVKIENISIPNENNIYRIKENEFEIKDMNDNILDLEDFPMFLEVVLRKPREIGEKF